MQTLIEVVYQLSAILLAPVLVSLLGMGAWSLYTFGGVLREWKLRRQQVPKWQKLQDNVASANPTEVLVDLDANQLPWLVNRFLHKAQSATELPHQLERILAELEVESAGRLARLSLGVRLGPLLGLMGTLIPMGPALKGLAAGDIQILSENLVIVFSTTVLGIFIGGLSYSMLLARRQWYSHDLIGLEAWTRSLPNDPPSSAEFLAPHTQGESIVC